ncbi:hypothetical protein [Stenotrophomonas indicatrix]|uniref:hypothetical protein n=1 Tax=Stenotrophomonas indicatrix TaxID=2045451 RepID=UPI001F084DB9|nr:hypothetical protein [Stenotrophomonas indicatrix]
MERDRHEPTFSAPDLQEVQFRSQRQRAPRHSEPQSPWLYIIGGAALLIAIAMGLIEWNARRQAAAMTRELMRPATPEEQAELKRQTDAWERKMQSETAAEMEQMRRQVWGEGRMAVPPRRPLNRDERCIDGRRLQRIEGGWRDLPSDPC